MSERLSPAELFDLMIRNDLNFNSFTKDKMKARRFQDNQQLNSLLVELKELLSPIQESVNKRFENPSWPCGLIIGPPRSGTTIFLQFLASTGNFAYPTNMLTRFAYAPYIGALIQKMLFESEFDFQGEFADIQSSLNFSSELGKSQGALASNEFLHFWRLYMPNYFPKPFTRDELESINYSALLKALSSIESAFEKPFIAKGVLLQYNILTFFEKMPQIFFFRICRDPLFIAQSLGYSREKYYGSREVWWSVKPREYEDLKVMDVYHQIAGQVYFTERAIEKGLKQIPEDHQMKVSYEEFCKNPKQIYLQIVEKYSALGCELNPDYKGPELFKCSNQIRLPIDDIKGLKSAYDDFASGKITFNH